MESEKPTSLYLVQTNPRHFQFIELSRLPGLRHAVFTRQGGNSRPPFLSLNISYDVEDRPESVSENILKIKRVFDADHVFFLNQQHGDDIFILRGSNADQINKTPAADAVITDIPRVALMIKQADCQGIILYDPKKRVTAAVHCGWRGNVKNIPAKVVIKMRQVFGCRESDLKAGIGPALGPCCGEFVDYRDIFPREFKRFMIRKNHFDLWALTRFQLESAGLRPENIETAGICTRCRTDLFFSYRAEGKTGRFGTVAMLKASGLSEIQEVNRHRLKPMA